MSLLPLPRGTIILQIVIDGKVNEYLQLCPRSWEYFPEAESRGEYSQLRGDNFKHSPITSVTICFVIPQTIPIITQNRT